MPKRVRTLRGRAGGHRVTALSDRVHASPSPTTASRSALLARAIDVAGAGASGGRARRCGSACAPCGRYQAPDGDLAYFGRSQGQSWALALATSPPQRAAGPSCDRRARAFRAVADRAMRRLGALHPIGPAGMAIVPSADGPATIPAIDDYASEVVYNGLTLTALGWAADGARRESRVPPPATCSATTAAARRCCRSSARASPPLRRGRVWMAVKQSSQLRDGRAAFGIRALKRRARGGAWVDLVPAAPAVPGRPHGSLGPALLLRSGALARPRGTRIRVRARADRGARRLEARRALGAPRRRLPLHADRARRAHRRLDAQGRPDRLLGPHGRPAASRPAAASPTRSRSTRASRTAAVRMRGPFASSSSLAVWRSDLTVRATGPRVRFTVSAR